MKTKIVFIVLALLLCNIPSNSQTRPFLSDFGSNFGSRKIKSKYIDAKKVERDIQKELEFFISEYGQRSIYIVSSQLLVENIKTEIQEALNRYTSLNQRNESLSPIFSYSTKKTSKKKLKVIFAMLQNIKKETDNQSGSDIVYGEKLNLYQSITYSLLDIYRLMDQIENAIEKTSLTNKVLN